jgi:hypothetical protein
LLNIRSEGHAILYNGGSQFAEWWDYGIREIADKLQSEGGVSRPTLDELFAYYRDPPLTTTISFTATTAQRSIRTKGVRAKNYAWWGQQGNQTSDRLKNQ